MEYYVVRITDQEGVETYVGRPDEGSYHPLTRSLQGARWFITKLEAEDVLKHNEFVKRIVFCDKSSAPPSAIWTGLGIRNTRPSAEGLISILRISTDIVFVKHIKDNLID